jgi:hypothetical protein
VRIAAVVLALALGSGLYRFVTARPAIQIRLPRLAQDPSGRANLAFFLYGPTVRVSSVDARYHPAYLVDGHAQPSTIEKWASAAADSSPWAEVQLSRPHEIDEVALELAGAYEAEGSTMRRYRIECFRGASLVSALPVQSNAAPRPHHPIRCPATDRVRVTFEIDAGTPRAAARVYELEIWGR